MAVTGISSFNQQDLIPPAGFKPVYTHTYIFAIKNDPEQLQIVTILPDNAPEWNIPELGISTESTIAQAWKAQDPDAVDTSDYLKIQNSKLPTECDYITAWTYDKNADIGNGAKGIGINTSKAKELHKNLIRLARIEAIAKLDIDFQRALESGADTTAIISKKTLLRDFPARVDSLNITETTLVGVTNQIKAVWDTDLLGTFDFTSGSEPDFSTT